MPSVPPVQSTPISPIPEPPKSNAKTKEAGSSKVKSKLTPSGTYKEGSAASRFHGEPLIIEETQALIQECDVLHRHSVDLAQDVMKAEDLLAEVKAMKTGEKAIFSIVGLPIHHINVAQQSLINPFILFEQVGLDPGDNLEKADTALFSAELMLRVFRGTSLGSLLIFKHKYIQQVEKFLSLLIEKSKLLPPDSVQAKQMDSYIEELKEKIKVEKIHLEHAAKKLGVTITGYVPGAVSALWELCAHIPPVASVALVSATSVASIGVSFYEKYKAEKALSLHQEWSESVKKLSEKHSKSIPDRIDVTYEKRKELKTRLKELTLKKHETVEKYLKFSSLKRNIDFFGSTLLTLAIMSAAIVGAFVSVGMLIVFPQFVLLGFALALVAIGTYYWATNRPNLFVELLKTSMKSLYYSIGNAIDTWKLQKAKVKLLKVTSQRIDSFAEVLKQRKKIGKSELEIFSKEHQELKKRVETLESDVKYWDGKRSEIQTRLLDAELADIARNSKVKTLDVKTIIADISNAYKFLTVKDKEELKEVVGLDLELGNNPTNTAIQHRLLDSYLGIDEEEHLKALNLKHSLKAA